MNSFKNASELRESFSRLKILVIGDLMLDRYLWGVVSRISPEAPVPVVDIHSEENRPGGAANVALNVAALGAEVHLAGVIGDDAEGSFLLDLLNGNGFLTEHVLSIPDRPTTRKTRVIGNNQQMMRVDREVRSWIGQTYSDRILDGVLRNLAWYDAVIFEDYEKGLLAPSFVQQVIRECNAKGILTVVDPKFHNFLAYSHCGIFKPNLKELNEALGKGIRKSDTDGVREGVSELQSKMPHKETVITLSENGVLAVDAEGKSFHIPAHLRKITDVSGAGDTVVSVLCAARAAGLSLPLAAEIANLAGGLVCEEVGVIPVDPDRLVREIDILGILK